jgi:hypothetical protein
MGDQPRQRPALNRLAHLFCEMMLRMEVIGRARDGSCALPITQADLSDATGLSVSMSTELSGTSERWGLGHPY